MSSSGGLSMLFPDDDGGQPRVEPVLPDYVTDRERAVVAGPHQRHLGVVIDRALNFVDETGASRELSDPPRRGLMRLVKKLKRSESSSVPEGIRQGSTEGLSHTDLQALARFDLAQRDAVLNPKLQRDLRDGFLKDNLDAGYALMRAEATLEADAELAGPDVQPETSSPALASAYDRVMLDVQMSAPRLDSSMFRNLGLSDLR